MQELPRVVVAVSSGASNVRRRDSLRKSWFRYLTDASPLPPERRQQVLVRFLISKEGAAQYGSIAQEQEQHGDLVLLDAPEGYGHLWRKALVFFKWLEDKSAPAPATSSSSSSNSNSNTPTADLGGAASSSAAVGDAATGARCSANLGTSNPNPAADAGEERQQYHYIMHADDDSFLRLDLLLPLLDDAPRGRYYWGYIWDGTGKRTTAPIRNPANKSHMPHDQYPLDYYPPFASGCGFILSRDLVQALLAQPLPDYRLLDPPFGIHLCGGPRCIVAPPVVPVHDERVRPYRPLPTFRPDTIVQHYLQPEEMRPFFHQALDSAEQDAGPRGGANGLAASQGGQGHHSSGGAVSGSGGADDASMHCSGGAGGAAAGGGGGGEGCSSGGGSGFGGGVGGGGGDGGGDGEGAAGGQNEQGRGGAGASGAPSGVLAGGGAGAGADGEGGAAAEALYNQLVAMGLLRR